MLLSLVPQILALTVLGLLLFRVIRHFWDPKGLRQHPAPSIAGFSSLWRIYQNLRWNHYAAIHDAHRRLGTHVRIAPNHISILDPMAPQQIYGHGANMLKDIWYDAAAGPHRNLSDARDKAEHQAKRKMFAHTFAAKTVVGFEPQLRENISTLLDVLDRHEAEGTKANMRRLLNYFLVDLFGQLLYGHKLGCLERNDDLLVAESKDGRIYRVPFIQSLLDSTVMNNVLAITAHYADVSRLFVKNHPYKKAGADWENIIYHNTKRRLENTAPANDLFQCLLQDSKGQDLNLSFGEIMAECSVMMNAGTETSTAAMTSTIFLLYTHPRVLQKLRDEINADSENEIPTYDVVSKMPYLRACIEEALRLRPPSSFGLPRIVPKGGRAIANKFIPEGVTVSVPTYSILRDELIFKNASEYNPDRWLTEDSEEKKRMMNSHIPFSTGPRACIGRNISYFEQAVVIATIVKLYDGDIEEGFQLETQERFNSNPGELPMRMRRRRV
ncbi:Cytochrome P450 [Penicillium camemberti]|uniref:Cytochrome P450 n=1 Tax=Penicillium camemberti (strain FM 013) TaxID=1429867 RepID=A0A0G4P9K2_PENC3|nr:Cytochrome P450 [Penicillium camemberti]